jgi:polyhydroxyalkanoate synthesis regulator phasin
MSEEQRAKDGIRDGLKAGIGILSALKDAIEETVGEMSKRGDITPERAKEAVRSTMQKVQDAMGDARERLDFVPRAEFDALKAEVVALRARVDAHEAFGAHGSAPVGASGSSAGGATSGGAASSPGGSAGAASASGAWPESHDTSAPAHPSATGGTQSPLDEPR